MSVDKFLTANGWADDRLMQAYDLIWEVEQANKSLRMENDFNRALSNLEHLSALIAQARADDAELIGEEGE